jgi:hypothetical protein
MMIFGGLVRQFMAERVVTQAFAARLSQLEDAMQLYAVLIMLNLYGARHYNGQVSLLFSIR